MMNKKPMQLDTHTIHEQVSMSPSKTQLVLVHGLGVSGDYYHPFAEQMVHLYDIHIIDLPGFGKTPKPRSTLTIEELAQVLIDYIEEKQLKDVVIVGQSMGCQIIAHAVAAQPALFRRMILLAPTVNKDERHVLRQTYRLIQDVFFEPPSAVLLVLRDYMRMGLRRYLSTTKHMIADHIEKTLNRCPLPILIVRGKNDKIVPHDWVHYLSQAGPNRTMVEIAHSPHLLHYKTPEELVDICQHFIAN